MHRHHFGRRRSYRLQSTSQRHPRPNPFRHLRCPTQEPLRLLYYHCRLDCPHSNLCRRHQLPPLQHFSVRELPTIIQPMSNQLARSNPRSHLTFSMYGLHSFSDGVTSALTWKSRFVREGKRTNFKNVRNKWNVAKIIFNLKWDCKQFHIFTPLIYLNKHGPTLLQPKIKLYETTWRFMQLVAGAAV